MRFVVLYTWIKAMWSQTVKFKQLLFRWRLVSLLIGNPETSNDPPLDEQPMRWHHCGTVCVPHRWWQVLSIPSSQITPDCHRMTDYHTESHSRIQGSPRPGAGLGTGFPLDAPWGAPARPHGSSQGRWEHESFPCGSYLSGLEWAGFLGPQPGWTRDHQPSDSKKQAEKVLWFMLKTTACLIVS